MTTRGPLLTASSPYARRGVLWDAFRQHYGPGGSPSVLVAKGTTRDFNPNIPQEEIDRELERDPIKNRAEYLAEFRADIESFVRIEAVKACVSTGIYERQPQRGVAYAGFVDPSGGSSDSMTLAIGHNDFSRQVVIIDALREVKPPFSPEQVVEDFCRLLKNYGVASIVGDCYGGEWPREQFSKFGVTYEPSAAPKSDLFRDLLPLINSARIELLDHGKLIAQLTGLERRTARGGRDSIDHSPGGHDDVANAVAGLAAIANKYGSFDASFSWLESADADEDQAASWRAARLRSHIFACTGHFV